MFSLIGLLEASAAGGICILLFFLVSQLFGEKYGAGYKKAIWLLIALRMCIPVSTSLFPQPFTVQVPVVVLGERGGQKTEIEDNALKSESGIGTEGMQGEAFAAGNPANGDWTEGNEPGEDELTGDTQKEDGQESFRYVTSQDIIVILWGCGSVGVLLYYLAVHFLFCSRMKRASRECTDEGILAITAESAAEIGLKNIPKVRLLKDAGTGPFTVGFFRNAVYLPDMDYQEKDLRYIVKHELAHCAGRDTQMKALFVLLNAVHWFNPLAWLMKSLADQDMELACDERVLADTTKEERSEYSEVLMACIGTDRAGRTVFSTGYVQGVKFIKKRFRNIFNTQKRSGKVGVCLLVVLLMAASVSVGFEAGRMVYAKSRITIDSGIELRTDVTGDGVPDKIQIYDDTYTLITSVGLQTADGQHAFFQYDDETWASSYMVSGDLNGNGAADIVVMRISDGMHSTGIPSVLYVSEEAGKFVWKEYSRKLIPNSAIAMEQPENFDDIPIGWVGATIIEKDGRRLLRLVAIDEKSFMESEIENQDDTVVCMDCSWREDGWYIEDMQVVPGFYTEGKQEELLKNNIYGIRR